MKRILMVLDNGFKPDLRVQKEINTLIKLGYSIDLYCWDQEGDMLPKEEINQLKIYRVKLVVEKQQGIKKIIDLVKFYILAFSLIRKNRVDYNFIYVHDFLLLPFGVFLKAFFRLKLIYDAHEIYHLMEWEKYSSTLRQLIFFTEKLLSRFADGFIVVNQTRKDFYSKYIKNKIDIVGNWYDRYNGEMVSLKNKYNIPHKDIVVSYFGVINFNERPINKFIEPLMAMQKIHFFVAGVGRDEDSIKEYSRKYDRVHYLGWQENIRQFLNDVDFIIYYMNDQRKYFEYTAPNTLYLAISHGTPIITNVPGESKTLINNNNIGYFIDTPENISDEIKFDLDSTEYLGKISSISKIRDNFKWSECEGTYNSLFARIS